MVEIAKIVIKVGGQEIAMTPEEIRALRDILDNFLPRQTIPPPVIGHRAPWPFTDDLSLVLVRRKADDTIIIEDFDVYCVANSSIDAEDAALSLMRAWGYRYTGWVSNIKLIASDVEHKAPNPLVVTSGVVA